MKLIHAQIAEAQKKYDLAKRELVNSVIDLDVDDQKVIELRSWTQQLYRELKSLDAKILGRWW